MSYQIPFPAGASIVELGGGGNPSFRPNLDFRAGPTVDIVGDLSAPLPIADQAFDCVFSRYAFEHVSWRTIKSLLAETYRIMKPGGHLVLILPNLLEQARVLVNKVEWEENDLCMLFGDQDYAGNFHCNGFSPEYASRLLAEAGFRNVIVIPLPGCKTDMIVEARK